MDGRQQGIRLHGLWAEVQHHEEEGLRSVVSPSVVELWQRT